MLPPGTPWRPGPGEEPSDSGGGRRGGWRALVLGLAAVLVVCAIGGGAWAFTSLRGGGTQPDAVLPGTSMGYVRVDLDPSAGQKVALYELAQKFPALKEKFGSKDDDLRKTLFEAIKSDSDELSDVDYAQDVKPWLGDRMGIAAIPAAEGSEDPDWAWAIQVKDEDEARTGIKKLTSGESYGIAFDQGYAVLAEDQKRADQFVAAAKDSSLADNEQFTGDVDALGETGIFSFWFDSKALSAASGHGPAGAGLAAQSAKGRVAGALRFDSRYVELAGITRGVPIKKTDTSEPSHLGDLPESTAVGLSFSGAGDAVAQGWKSFLGSMKKAGAADQVQAYLNMAKDQYGIEMPQDLQTLLGKNVTLALDSNGLQQLAASLQGMGSGTSPMPGENPYGNAGDDPYGDDLGGDFGGAGYGTVPTGDPATGGPKIGAVLTTDPDKAEQVVDKLLQAMSDGGVAVPLAKEKSDSALALASDPAYAKELLKKGSLGKTEAYKLAVPDGDKSQGGLFVNIDKLEKLYLSSLSPEQKANLQPLQAFGASGSITGDGQSTFTVRLVVN